MQPEHRRRRQRSGVQCHQSRRLVGRRRGVPDGIGNEQKDSPGRRKEDDRYPRGDRKKNPFATHKYTLVVLDRTAKLTPNGLASIRILAIGRAVDWRLTGECCNFRCCT
ncbi:hypothetical protein ACP275_08G032700 [Erythranthe tilingii]